MLQTTRGIILNHIKYSENSVIVNAYTEEFGRTAFMMKQNRNKKNLSRPALFMPLALVNMEFVYMPKRQIQSIKEISFEDTLISIRTDFYKNSIATFLAEVFTKTLKEEEANAPLFNFIHQSVLYLENCQDAVTSFHLIFMIRLTKYLGVYPNNEMADNSQWFDMKEGVFVFREPPHRNFIANEECLIFSEILKNNTSGIYEYPVPVQVRSSLLEKLIKYYSIHIPALKEIKSYEVFKEVFSV